MTFVESINTCFKQKYVDFNGRASRSEYWWFALLYFLVLIAVIALTGGMMDESGDFSTIGIIGFLLVVIIFFLPSLAVSVRRLHDINMSGWWYLISLVPYVGGLVLLVFMVLPPKEPNRFGDTPLS
jgi:uncharacterized membrane protein YhaH (DUF805 family)